MITKHTQVSHVFANDFAHLMSTFVDIATQYTLRIVCP